MQQKVCLSPGQVPATMAVKLMFLYEPHPALVECLHAVEVMEVPMGVPCMAQQHNSILQGHKGLQGRTFSGRGGTLKMKVKAV